MTGFTDDKAEEDLKRVAVYREQYIGVVRMSEERKSHLMFQFNVVALGGIVGTALASAVGGPPSVLLVLGVATVMSMGIVAFRVLKRRHDNQNTPKG